MEELIWRGGTQLRWWGVPVNRLIRRSRGAIDKRFCRGISHLIIIIKMSQDSGRTPEDIEGLKYYVKDEQKRVRITMYQKRNPTNSVEMYLEKKDPN